MAAAAKGVRPHKRESICIVANRQIDLNCQNVFLKGADQTFDLALNLLTDVGRARWPSPQSNQFDLEHL
jgi:hypothetical protein